MAEFSDMIYSTALSELRSVAILADGDLHDLAVLKLRVFDALAASKRTIGTTRPSFQSLATAFVILFPEITRQQVMEKIEAAGFNLDNAIVWDEEAIIWETEADKAQPVFLRRWRSETVLVLAAGIVADEAYDRLPILADAMEEAGCDDAGLLADCRNPHLTPARTRWVMELVLGAE